jgi:hypothetical protein
MVMLPIIQHIGVMLTRNERKSITYKRNYSPIEKSHNCKNIKYRSLFFTSKFIKLYKSAVNTQNFFSILILNRRLTKIYFSGLNRHGDVANNTAHWSNADKEEVNLESELWENGHPKLSFHISQGITITYKNEVQYACTQIYLIICK